MIYKCPTCGSPILASTLVVSKVFRCTDCHQEMALSVTAIAYLWAVALVMYVAPVSMLAMIAGRIAGWTIVFVNPWTESRIVFVSPSLSWSEVFLNGFLIVPTVAFVIGLLLGLVVAARIRVIARGGD